MANNIETTTSTTTPAVGERGAQGASKKASAKKTTAKPKATPTARKGATRAAATKKRAASKEPKPKKIAAAAATRTGSKKAQVLDMLRRETGASLDEIGAATGWQRHTIRGLVSILGRMTNVESSKGDDGTRRYRIAGAK